MRPKEGYYSQTTEGGCFHYIRRGRKKLSTKEYKCILHYEGERIEKSLPSMVEAVQTMQNAMISEKKPIFTEVVLITTERVAYSCKPKETL